MWYLINAEAHNSDMKRCRLMFYLLFPRRAENTFLSFLKTAEKQSVIKVENGLNLRGDIRLAQGQSCPEGMIASRTKRCDRKAQGGREGDEMMERLQ